MPGGLTRFLKSEYNIGYDTPVAFRDGERSSASRAVLCYKEETHTLEMAVISEERGPTLAGDSLRHPR